MTTNTHDIVDVIESSVTRPYEKKKWVAYIQYALGIALMLPLALDSHFGMWRTPQGPSAPSAEPEFRLVVFEFVMLNGLYLGRVFKERAQSPPNKTGDYFLIVALFFAILWSASCIWFSGGSFDQWLMPPSEVLFLITTIAVLGTTIDLPTIGRWRERRIRVEELRRIREEICSRGRVE